MINQLIKSIPLYERKSALINSIFYAAAKQLETLNTDNMGNYDELFIDTAVKALQIHAKDLGIALGSGLSLKQQRELITAHYRASFEQTTEETIKNVAAAFSNGEVEINTTDTAGVFEIKFIGNRGVPNNMEGLKQTIATIVPAHLAFIYTYVLNTYQDLSLFTHEQLAAYTHQQVREDVIS
ncbi:MAG: putative phage tail protein [Lysinibacillus sp.]